VKAKQLIFISLILITPFFCPIGNKGTYKFLDLATTPRILGLGSDFVVFYDDDIMLALSNPSIINKELNNKIGFHLDYFL
jgi:hypothetical protein